MTVDLEAVKCYMKIDDDAEDPLILSLADSAESYLTSAGIRPPPASDEGKYTLAVSALTLQYYEHRSDGGDLPPALDRLIAQLRFESL